MFRDETNTWKKVHSVFLQDFYEQNLFSFSDMKDRTYINSTAENLCQKLESLEVAKIPISPLKLLAVQVEVFILFDGFGKWGFR